MRALWISISLLLAAGCWTEKAASPVLVKVNGQAITQADVEKERVFHRMQPGAEPTPGIANQEDEVLLETLIDRALYVQRAESLDIGVSDRDVEELVKFSSRGAAPDEFEKALNENGLNLSQWKKRLKDQELAQTVFKRDMAEKIVITPQQVKDYYWVHITRYRHKKKILLSQIVCKDKKRADAAFSELLLGDPFDAVARRYSEGPEASQGGVVGWMLKNELPRQIAGEAFSLKKNTLSMIIESPHGWHILRVDDTQAARNLSIEEVTPLIRQDLRRDLEQDIYREWLFGLRKDAQIERLPQVQRPLKENPS